MVDVKAGGSKQFTLRITDDVGVKTTSVTAAAASVEDSASNALPVSLISKSPESGDATQVDATFAVEVSGLDDDLTLKLNPNVVQDTAGNAVAGADLQTGIRAYKTLDFQGGPSFSGINCNLLTGGKTEWVFQDADNSRGSDTYVGEYMSFNPNANGAYAFGAKYFAEPTQLEMHSNPKVSVDLTQLASLTKLRKLKVDGTLVDLTGFDFSPMAAELKDLNVSGGDTELTDAQVAVLTNLESIAAGQMSGVLTDAAFPEPQKMKSFNFNQATGVALTDATLAAGTINFVDMPDTPNTTITDASLAAMTQAVFVNLSGCGGTFTGGGIKNLKEATFLGFANLNLTGLDDSVLAAIPQVEALYIGKNTHSLTPSGFAPLINLTQLGIDTMGWSASDLDAIMAQLVSTAPNLNNLTMNGNPGQYGIDKSPDSAYETLVNRGVNMNGV